MRHLVSVFESKSNLSKLIERVQSGEEVIITNRGNPVARLIAYESKSPLRLGVLDGESFEPEVWDEQFNALFKERL